MSERKAASGSDRIFGHIDPDAMKVVRRLRSAGHEAYLVGGCVRDLYVGLRPKDFDVATSATPEAIRKQFRNSRIIGRRFKLAHVFFGPKIIETSTFRTAPAQDDDDPLITHDNEWGTVEDDARRRDFTINGLFYDVETRDIVDFVGGLEDLDRQIVRTIGEPELRFREDPVRMIRAIKFAARLDFQIEEKTWQALLDVAPDIVRSSRARLLEEIYKLLRSGASRRCFELLLESGMLHRIMPDYSSQFGADDDGLAALQAGLEGPPVPIEAEADASEPTEDEDDDDARPPAAEQDPAVAHHRAAALWWNHLDALDDYVRQTRDDVVNGVLLATLFAPLIHEQMRDGSRQALDRAIEEVMTPVSVAFGVARRDRELARQILMAHRRLTAPRPRRGRRGRSGSPRHHFHDALVFLGISVQAIRRGTDDTTEAGGELARWKALLVAQKESSSKERSGGSRKRSRRRRGGRRNKKPKAAARASASSDG